MNFDVVTIGEAMLRLSVPAGVRLEEAQQLDLHVAGAEANTAIALAQLGRSVTWISGLPTSPLGRRVDRELRANGVDTSHVQWVDGERMGLYFVELAGPPRPVSVVYDRAGSAAAAMAVDQIHTEVIDSAKVVHLSGITPALSKSCRHLSLHAAERARSSSARLTVDINYRAKLWSPEDAKPCLTELAEGADLVVITREDAVDVFGVSGEALDMASRLRKLLGAGCVVLTLGDGGSVWDSDEGTGSQAAIPTVIVDRLGAGDAFMAGVIDGLLADDIDRGVQTGTALASLALGTRGDHVTTTRDEVERILAGRGRSVDR
jgi:2-dehydro-3-deoxygluconokinase